MALDIDGFVVLRNIGAHPAAFPDLTGEVAKTARALVARQIKSKTSSLKSLRDVRKALGTDAFALIVDGIADAQIKLIVTRLDKHYAELKTAKASLHRQHLDELLTGAIEPRDKPKLDEKRSQGKKTVAKELKPLELLNFRSAGATRAKR
jgi:hypothetical protein